MYPKGRTEGYNGSDYESEDEARELNPKRGKVKEAYGQGSQVIAAAQVRMLTKTDKISIEDWANSIRLLKAGNMDLRHVEYIKPELLDTIDMLAELEVGFVKPEGDWRTWSLEDLVKVLKSATQIGDEHRNHATLLDALKNCVWEQNIADLSFQSLMTQINKVKQQHGDTQLSKSDAAALVSEIKRQLRSERIPEQNRKYNKNVAEMLEDTVRVDKDALSSIKSIMVAIGNYNNETKKQLDVLIAKLGPNVFKLGNE